MRPDPSTANDAAQFVALLRDLRELSGLTYRQIQRRAEAMQLNLPPSTLATMLGRETFPREELVTTLLRCCDEEPEPWLTAYHRLRQEQRRAARPVPAPAEEPVPVAPPRRVPRKSVVIVALIGLMALFGLTAASATPQQTQWDSLVPGEVLIISASTRLCVSEWGLSKDGFLYLRECHDHVVPQRTLDDLGQQRYRIRTWHTEYGPGCMGFQRYYRKNRPGDAACEEVTGTELRLIRVSGPVSGYLVKSIERGTCLSIEAGDQGVGSDIVYADCDPADPGQIYVFAPAYGR